MEVKDVIGDVKVYRKLSDRVTVTGFQIVE